MVGQKGKERGVEMGGWCDTEVVDMVVVVVVEVVVRDRLEKGNTGHEVYLGKAREAEGSAERGHCDV